MSDENRLVTALREGVGVVQMLLYKELKERLKRENPRREEAEISMLAGAVTGEVFAAKNPEEKFVSFRKNHRAEIEQELLGLKQNIPQLIAVVTDALRIQVLCDYHENKESSALLQQAKNYGFLIGDREIPLPSAFMTSIRELGKRYNLVIPPVEINKEKESELFH